MNRLARLCFFLVLASPALARAETIGVRSGDHAGFTRLVVQFGAGEDWVFGRVDGGFELRPGRDDIRYRLDRVYDKIGRTRIADVRDLGDGRLFLAVDCACHGVVDELASGQVVLDIVAGAAGEPGTGVDAPLPPLVEPTETPGEVEPDSPVEVVQPTDPPRKPVVVSDRAGLPLTLPRVGSRLSLPDPLPVTQPMPQPMAPDPADLGAPAAMTTARDAPEPLDAPTEAEPVDRDTDARIAETETALLEQIARAAAQGLLDADMAGIDASVAQATPQAREEIPPPEVERPLPPVAPRGHISVETGVDRAGSGVISRSAETDEGDICIDPNNFDIAQWGRPLDNGTDFGTYRSQIIGEFDIADGEGVTALARNYVYITFGAEAKALMRHFPDKLVRPDLLYAMAEIMDEGQSATAADLVDQMACDGATALWATLAQPELRPGHPVNRDVVALEFAALPAHLRTHLGPGLAERFLAAGDRDTADLIRAAIDRASDTSSSEYAMLTAHIDLADGHVDEATATFDDVVSAGDEVLPEALLHRVEATLANGGAVPDDIVLLLDGLVTQYRGTETAALMADAGIRARASTSDFTAAFAQLEAAESAGLIGAERSAVLRAGLFERLTRDASDTGFLRHLLPRVGAVTGLSPAVRRDVSARLLDLGLTGPAMAALDHDGVMPEDADRVLLARGALLDRRPAAAIGYLAGLSNSEAKRLRAEALATAKDHAGAMRAYEEAGDPAGMLRAAWQGGLWSEVAVLDQGPQGAAAVLMTDDPAPAPGGFVSAGPRTDGATSDPAAGEDGADSARVGTAVETGTQPTLAAAQALLTESSASRATLSALFATVTQPTAATPAAPEPGS